MGWTRVGAVRTGFGWSVPVGTSLEWAQDGLGSGLGLCAVFGREESQGAQALGCWVGRWGLLIIV